MPWLDSSCLIIERGMTGATGNIYCGLHEFADMALVLHYFSAGDGLFVDVGANIGSYTVLASKVCGTATISIEPLPSTFERLERNIAANRITDLVEAHCSAAGSEAGQIKFTSDRDTMNQAVDDAYGGPCVTVPVSPLDDIQEGRRAGGQEGRRAGGQEGRRAGCWKVDVEGFERQVLDGATRSLNDDALEIVLLEGDDESIRGIMEGAGFVRRVYDPFAREFSGLNDDKIVGNHVWVRESEGLCQRLRDAHKRTIYGVEF